jgi:two-component system NtrC family sensor kinase
MINAGRQSIYWLRLALVAAVALPVLLFGYAAVESYYSRVAFTERQIEQSRDIANEHALRVFEAIGRGISEINELISDMSDRQILANQDQLQARLKQIAAGSPQIKSFWVYGRNGRALINSLGLHTPEVDFSDRDYFKVHVDRDIGTYIGEVLTPRPPYTGAPFFSVSRRRTLANGGFAGVIQASVLPTYFEQFFATIAQGRGSYFALVRNDGLVLARYPAPPASVQGAVRTRLAEALRTHPERGAATVVSAVDGVERRLSYMRLAEFPLYVVAGFESAATRDEWLTSMAAHLIFGLPATAALVAIIALVIRRTRSLYAEAERRQAAEAALKQAQRLEALGRLTGGVAHDFNNLLMVVGGSARKLKRDSRAPADLRAIAMIEAAVGKGESLTRKLLAFSRRQTLSARPIDLGGTIERLRSVLEQAAPGSVTFEVSVPSQPVTVRIDPDELEIALLNLTLNARDAMPDGGRIRIALETREIADGESLEGGGRYAAITFADTGSGIADDIRDRIFEPFFTTKSVERGTGLGLSQVYGFVQQSSGTISVESEVGRGTRFTILLPVRDEEPEQPPAADPPIRALPPLTVLLVEDHEDVAVVAADILRDLGCAAVRARSAEDALEILNARRDVDAVFSDVVMPGMGGLELARLMRAHHPETPIVLASGYSDSIAAAIAEGFTLLRKPYTPAQLAEALAQVTGQPETVPSPPTRASA